MWNTKVRYALTEFELEEEIERLVRNRDKMSKREYTRALKRARRALRRHREGQA